MRWIVVTFSPCRAPFWWLASLTVSYFQLQLGWKIHYKDCRNIFQLSSKMSLQIVQRNLPPHRQNQWMLFYLYGWSSRVLSTDHPWWHFRGRISRRNSLKQQIRAICSNDFKRRWFSVRPMQLTGSIKPENRAMKSAPSGSVLSTSHRILLGPSFSQFVV